MPALATLPCAAVCCFWPNPACPIPPFIRLLTPTITSFPVPTMSPVSCETLFSRHSFSPGNNCCLCMKASTIPRTISRDSSDTCTLGCFQSASRPSPRPSELNPLLAESAFFKNPVKRPPIPPPFVDLPPKADPSLEARPTAVGDGIGAGVGAGDAAAKAGDGGDRDGIDPPNEGITFACGAIAGTTGAVVPPWSICSMFGT
mmetsp:Transcript_40055/g.63606  ORF Transcript_40055/g.63606 Transcript_40055/m.63606 type:complete len:202 (+) Transcript_40055:1337-1942(+)